MSTLGKRVIYVGPADGANHKPLNVEGLCVAAMAPGTILKQDSSGLDINDNAATVFGQRLLIADKDQMRTKSVDTNWTINENMVAIAPRSGEFFNALTATGLIISAGVTMTRNGAGLFAFESTPTLIDCDISDNIIITTNISNPPISPSFMRPMAARSSMHFSIVCVRVYIKYTH